VLVAIAVAAIWAVWTLELGPAALVPSPGGASLLADFALAAFQPALTSQGGPGVSLVGIVAAAAWNTIAFAAAGMSVALVGGAVLGVLSSTRFWTGRRLGGPAVAGFRVLIALMRSVHELLWAILFLAALGLSGTTAVIAIAIPYTGMLAKVFSEILDEAPSDAADALLDLGATRLQAFALGLVPRALPDLSAYAFYRFECALRSAAVLGFFGLPTLGYHVAASAENLYFNEVWTYLYVLFALEVVADVWSGALRRRLVVR
jgi:phosphonate transport system permease protein